MSVVLLTARRLFDGRTPHLFDERVVAVEDGRIVEVADRPRRGGAEVVDLGDVTLLLGPTAPLPPRRQLPRESARQRGRVFVPPARARD